MLGSLAPLHLLLLLLLLLLLTVVWTWPRLFATAVLGGGLGIAVYGMGAGRFRRQDRGGEPDDRPRPRPAAPPSSRQQLPLSGQISADYSDTDGSPLRGVDDLPDRLFQVARGAANPLDLGSWSYASQKTQESARVTHFAWTVPRWQSVATELESPEFKDAKMEGVSWRCLLRRERLGSRRLQVLVQAVQLDPASFPEGRLFAEVCCCCGDVRRSSLGTFYPGVYEFALGLDARRLQLRGGDPSAALTVSCTLAVFSRVPVHQLAELPTSCRTDSRGRYVTCHSAGIRWQVADWEQFEWQPGWAVFSPLFCAASLPGYLWQVHLFPASDEPASAGRVSAFLKLVDCTVPGGLPVEVDFEVALQGDEDAGLFDTVGFVRGAARGFRGIRRLGELKGCPVLVECALRIKLPLFT